MKEIFHNISQKLFTPHLSTKEQIFFVKRLSFLINAGIPLLESLHMIRDQTKSKRYTHVLNVICTDVSSGQYLSKSLARFPSMWNEFAISIVHFGETSGMLSDNLHYLADEMRKKQILRKKIVSAFIYPAVVISATFAITLFLIVYLFPKIMPVFASLHMKLPLSTRIIISLSNFVRTDGLWLVLGIICFIILFSLLFKKNKWLRFQSDTYLLKIPLLGHVFRDYNLANSTRILGLLLKSNIAVTDALPIVAETSQNLAYKKEFAELSHTINRGEKISVHFSKNQNLFPDILTQIISVGERSGNLSHSLMYVSELYESEVDDFTKNLSNLIEPILMIFMGVLVGFIAISIITPIYGITQNLHS